MPNTFLEMLKVGLANEAELLDRKQRKEIADAQLALGQGQLEESIAARKQTGKLHEDQLAFDKAQADRARQWQALMGMSEGKLEQAKGPSTLSLPGLSPAAQYPVPAMPNTVDLGGPVGVVSPVTPTQQARNLAEQQEQARDLHRKTMLGAVNDFMSGPFGKSMSQEDKNAIAAFSMFNVQLPQKYMESLQAGAYQALVGEDPQERMKAVGLLRAINADKVRIAAAAADKNNPRQMLPWDVREASTKLAMEAYNEFSAAHKRAPNQKELVTFAQQLVASGRFKHPYAQEAVSELAKPLAEGDTLQEYMARLLSGGTPVTQ